MTLNNKSIWITGASTGIGEAVTKYLAAQSTGKIYVTARNSEKLHTLAKEYPDRVIPMPGDVTDLSQMKAIVSTITAQGPLDLALLNAGTYEQDGVADFTAARFARHTRINLEGVANALEPLLDHMRMRGSGHIAIVASVAGYRGLPRSASYGPTKAALINMAESLSIEASAFNIKIQVICPGFVKTPLTDKNTFPMPFLMDVDRAAERLVQGLSSSRFEITFPTRFALILKTLQLLPHKLYIALLRAGWKAAKK